MALSEPIVFEPIAMERVWGGRRLEALFGKKLPPGVPIGELWEVVDREDAQSVVHNAPYRGTTLNELWTTKREEVFGTAYAHHPAPRFPMLIKLLDARERLSVQVHPPVDLAASLNGEPKTEMWYFASTQPGANIYAGLKNGTTRDRFERLLRDGRVEETLHTASVEAGDSIFIPSGRLHAIGEGNVIVEVQQNSDTTYRVFDWNRVGLDGVPRKLHIEESMVSTDFEDFEPGIDHIQHGVIAECPYFRVEKLVIAEPIPATVDSRFAIFSVLSGSVTCGARHFQPGDFFLAPASLDGAVITPENGPAELLRSTLPV
jgi:mannose-6-phosphate isomerase